MTIDATAQGGGTYTVYVDDVAQSPTHTTERKAFAHAMQAKLDNPGAVVQYRLESYVVTISGSCPEAPTPEPPPPVEPPPSEPPPSGTVVPMFADDFESGDLSHTENGASWGASNRVKVSDAIAHSGTHSLRFHYQAAADGADSDAEQRFNLGRQVTFFAVEFWIYWPDGSDMVIGPRFVHRTDPNGPDNDKGFRLWGGDYNAHNKVGDSTWPVGDGDEKFGFEYSGPADKAIGQYRSGTLDDYLTDARRGSWHRLRRRYRMSSAAGVKDGSMEFWIDDVKLQAVDVSSGTPSTGLLIWNDTYPYWDQGYILGWANSGFAEDTYVYVDDVKFYDTDPGW